MWWFTRRFHQETLKLIDLAVERNKAVQRAYRMSDAVFKAIKATVDPGSWPTLKHTLNESEDAWLDAYCQAATEAVRTVCMLLFTFVIVFHAILLLSLILLSRLLRSR